MNSRSKPNMKVKEDLVIRKNILFFFSTTKIGGTETNFLGLAEDLNYYGCDIFVLTAKNDGPLFEKFKSFAKDIRTIELKKINQLSNVLQYRDFISRNNIDIVFNCGLKVEIFSRLFSHIFKVNKVISNIRSTDDWRRFYHTLLDRLTQFGVDIWVSNSKAGLNTFSKREKIDMNRSLVIYNYVKEFNPTKSKVCGINEQLLITIGILANLKEGKGFEDLIEIAKELYSLGTNNFLFLIGGMDYSNGRIPGKLKNSIYSEHFKLIGFVNDKQDFFDQIDIFFLPTYWEGFPTSILEAMNHGKPVVSTKVGGIPEMIEHEYNGYLSEPGRVKLFAHHIQKLSSSNELCNYFVDNSYKILEEKFTRSIVLKKWINILK